MTPFGRPIRVAVVSNGNFFSTVVLRPLLEDPAIEVGGALLVKVPPGKGGPVRTIADLVRKVGLPFAANKLAVRVWPELYARVQPAAVVSLDELCRRRGVQCRSVPSVNGEEAMAMLRAVRPDVLVSVSCPQRIVPEVLAIPSIAAVNFHAALLPAYAGISPYFWALLAGERETGATVHLMEPELDTGAILRQRHLAIGPDETATGLFLRLARAGGEDLRDAVRSLPEGLRDARRQDPSGRSYFTWPTAADVARLHRSGRRLARPSDYLAMFRAAHGQRREGT